MIKYLHLIVRVPPSHGKVQAPHGKVPPSHGKVPPSHGEVPPSHGEVPPSHGEVPPPQGEWYYSTTELAPHREVGLSLICQHNFGNNRP